MLLYDYHRHIHTINLFFQNKASRFHNKEWFIRSCGAHHSAHSCKKLRLWGGQILKPLSIRKKSRKVHTRNWIVKPHQVRALSVFSCFTVTNFGGHVRRRYFQAGGQDIDEVPDAGTYNLESMCDVTENTVEKLAGVVEGYHPEIDPRLWVNLRPLRTSWTLKC
jgi:hypothetical protein